MKNRYRGWGTYYCQDIETGKQESLRTRNKDEAFRLVAARNETQAVPAFSLQLARVHWKAGDPAAASRTWQQVNEEIPKLKQGTTRERWLCAIRDKDLDPIRELIVLETRSEHFLHVLKSASVSANSYLRRIHRFALDMNWLPWPVLPRTGWPVIRYKEKPAITWEEHRRIVAGESNPELRQYYELLWYLGGSQTDIATLKAENIDWAERVISYRRRKTHSLAVIRFDREVELILRSRPNAGCLFPQIARWKHSDRGSSFTRRCRRVGVSGVSLHSYRYAWAERAKTAGYLERFAQEALGHNSKAVHRAYSKNAQVIPPSLEAYESWRGCWTDKRGSTLN